MDAPINLSALGSSKKRCGGWRHLKGEEKSLNSHIRTQDGHDALDYTSLGESRHLKVSLCVCALAFVPAI